MKIWSIALTAILLISQPTILPAAGPAQGIKWVSTFEEAVTQAKAQKKPVFLDFYNPN